MKPTSLSLLSLLLAGHLSAGTTMVPGPEPVMTTTTDDGWHFTLGLYGWGAGLNGDLGAAGQVAPVDISFSEILDTLDMTAMGMAEIRKGRFLFQFEGLYLRNTIKRVAAYTPLGGGTISAKLTAETTRLEAVAGYRVVDNGCTTVDLLAGAVYYDITNTLSAYAPRTFGSIKGGDDWIDPIVGVRIRHRLGEHWSALLRGEVGGFGVNADIAWQAAALLGYDLGESSTIFAGWRHAAVDYQNGGFLYDVYSTGPIVGLVIQF